MTGVSGACRAGSTRTPEICHGMQGPPAPRAEVPAGSNHRPPTAQCSQGEDQRSHDPAPRLTANGSPRQPVPRSLCPSLTCPERTCQAAQQPTRVGTWGPLAQALSSDEDGRARVALIGRRHWVHNQLFSKICVGPICRQRAREKRLLGTRVQA